MRSFLTFMWEMRMFFLYLIGGYLLIWYFFLRDYPAPDWQLTDLEGQTIKLSDFKGKVVILDFWATWCPPCRAEIPNFVELQKEYGDKGLAVIGISVDQGGVEGVASFARSQNVNYPIVMGADSDVSMRYGWVHSIPTTFVIDPKGDVVHKHVGYTDKDEFESEIKDLLPQ